MTEPRIVQRLGTQVNYLSQRQALLSQNIANIDTPSYRAQDLKKLKFEDLASVLTHRIDMRMTAPNHLPPVFQDAGDFRSEKTRKTFEKKPVGNNVVLEEQMGHLSDVGAQSQLSTTLLKKFHQLYRTAVDSKG